VATRVLRAQGKRVGFATAGGSWGRETGASQNTGGETKGTTKIAP